MRASLTVGMIGVATCFLVSLRDASPPAGERLYRIIVTPRGPEDGGDFGPKTPGTRTSGLQEAFNAAKAQGKDLYICGGSWTQGGTPGVVYVLHETLYIPWMQDFRCDAGHCVIQYVAPRGDAVVFDSQMSCYYRFGLMVSNSDGAVVRLRPQTAGPDRSKVITTTEFHFNALVGGGGAWPSGEPFNNKLNPNHQWRGVGLWLDTTDGPIDSNRISVMEAVGCNRGVYLAGATTHNVLEVPMIHLCKTHLQIGGPGDAVPSGNRIDTFVDSAGIAESTGVRIYGHHNLVTLTAGQMSPGGDLVLEASARDNLITALGLPSGITNRARKPTNRLIASTSAGYNTATPTFPRSGEEVINRNPHPVEVHILTPGKTTEWKERDALGNLRNFSGPLHAGQVFTLDPGDRVGFVYQQAATWIWKGLR
jgi:hypothetical protein